MATNLVSVVMQFLTPDMIAKIASALGLDRSLAQKAIGRRRSRIACESGGRRCHPQWGTPAQQHAGAATDWSAREFQKPDRRLKPEHARGKRIGHAVRSVRRNSAGHDGTVDWQVRGTRRGNQQVATRYARPCGPRDLGSTAAQRGPGCERAGGASRLAKGSDRRGDSVRPGRSAERCRPYRPSDGNNAQRCSGSFGRRKPNCRRLGADGQQGSLRHNKCGIVAVALLVSRRGHIGRSRLVCLRVTNVKRLPSCRVPPQCSLGPQPWASPHQT